MNEINEINNTMKSMIQWKKYQQNYYKSLTQSTKEMQKHTNYYEH